MYKGREVGKGKGKSEIRVRYTKSVGVESVEGGGIGQNVDDMLIYDGSKGRDYFHWSYAFVAGCKTDDKIPYLDQSLSFYALSMSVHIAVHSIMNIPNCPASRFPGNRTVSYCRFNLVRAPETYAISMLIFRNHDYGKTHGVYERGLIQETQLYSV